MFSVRQGLRPDAQAVISALRSATSRSRFSRAIGSRRFGPPRRALGVSEWRAGVTPADKIARIEDLKRQGFKVMMVGDGLNDAPSLAAAHVSMSPISAAHLSQATADLVFLGKPLAPVVAAIDFSRKALHLMRQNLWLAVGYNLLAVPIAISGIVTPLIAAAAMSGSSLLVMLNALRARRVAPGRIVMEVMVILVPLALGLGLVGLLGFLWSLKSGQYDDLEGAAWRAIADDEPARGDSTGLRPQATTSGSRSAIGEDGATR